MSRRDDFWYYNIGEHLNEPSDADEHSSSSKKTSEIILDTEIKSINDDIKEVKDKIDETQEQTEKSKVRVVETLGLFIALFTFLSLQVQILEDQDSPEKILSFTLVTAGLIAFFVLILDLMLTMKSEFHMTKIIKFLLLFMLSIGLVGLGCLLIIHA